MAELAKKITIDRTTKRVSIDGQEFPWVIEESGPQVTDPLGRATVPVVTIPIFAEDIEIIPANGK